MTALLAACLAVCIANLHLITCILCYRLDADPDNWMDGGTWEGTMTDLLWDEDGEMCKCSPRPAAWHPPSKKTGRWAHDSLLSLKKYWRPVWFSCDLTCITVCWEGLRVQIWRQALQKCTIVAGSCSLACLAHAFCMTDLACSL